MELIDQHAKGIMEGCKRRARDAGLSFEDETLEYIVTNRDMIELSPKVMIPTLYDYWVHDVRVISGQGMYDLYPSNPYETVINTRPAISYYNDNNPDWLNVMIFYHVLGHIDFFQNNLSYRDTWNFDFTGQALADKRLIAKYRSEKGRWVDYIIEFAKGIDNLVSYHDQVAKTLCTPSRGGMGKLDYYFDVFLQTEKKVGQTEYLNEIERYNTLGEARVADESDQTGDPVGGADSEGESLNQSEAVEHTTSLEDRFFIDVRIKYPEFDACHQRHLKKTDTTRLDVMQYIIKHSDFLKKDENRWMKSVMEIIRNTSLVFQPQIRTKIMNEGWASIWHEMLFMKDDRIKGHEIDFAKVNAGVTAMPKVGLNPYALGMRLFYHIMEMEDRDCYSMAYFNLKDVLLRRKFDKSKGGGMDRIFTVRENLNDFTFINKYIDQEFVDKHKLFVSGKRINKERMTWQYYVKSRKAEAYRDMVIDTLYHPPRIDVDREKSAEGPLYLRHAFEGKPLKRDYLENTMIGIEFLWGKPVKLETSEPAALKDENPQRRFINFWNQQTQPTTAAAQKEPAKKKEIEWKRVLYIMENKKLIKREI